MARQIREDKGRQQAGIHQWQAADLVEKHGITIQHIQSGQPQQNAYIEHYNYSVRHEWLDQYIIETIEEVKDFATQGLWTYNNDCPNRGIGGITPAVKLKTAG
jgi:putative transposase